MSAMVSEIPVFPLFAQPFVQVQIKDQSSASLAFMRESTSQRACKAENVSIWWRHHGALFLHAPSVKPNLIVGPSSVTFIISSRGIPGHTGQLTGRTRNLHEIDGYAVVRGEAAHRTFASSCCPVVDFDDFRLLSLSRIGVKPTVDDLSWRR